jgi:hypothetical protein
MTDLEPGTTRPSDVSSRCLTDQHPPVRASRARHAQRPQHRPQPAGGRGRAAEQLPVRIRLLRHRMAVHQPGYRPHRRTGGCPAPLHRASRRAGPRGRADTDHPSGPDQRSGEARAVPGCHRPRTGSCSSLSSRTSARATGSPATSPDRPAGTLVRLGPSPAGAPLGSAEERHRPGLRHSGRTPAGPPVLKVTAQRAAPAVLTPRPAAHRPPVAGRSLHPAAWRAQCTPGAVRTPRWAGARGTGRGHVPGSRLADMFEDVDASGLHLRLTGHRRLENGSVTLTCVPGCRGATPAAAQINRRITPSSLSPPVTTFTREDGRGT